MLYSFYELVFYFFIYSFLGWISEVAFAAFKSGGFVNRGFLLGPVCPIYGFGVVSVLCLLMPLYKKPLLVYLLSVIITSAIEFLVGFISEKIFHQRLWDYSGCFMNIKGYVCLTFSLAWGVGCMAVIYVIHPIVSAVVGRLPFWLGIILISVFSAMLIADTVITLLESLKMERRMSAIEEISSKLEGISDKIGGGISSGTLRIKEKTEESEGLKKEYERLINAKNIVHDHLFCAFSNLKNGKYKDAYGKLKPHKEQNKDNTAS